MITKWESEWMIEWETDIKLNVVVIYNMTYKELDIYFNFW